MIRVRRWLWASILTCLAGLAWAQAPERVLFEIPPGWKIPDPLPGNDPYADTTVAAIPSGQKSWKWRDRLQLYFETERDRPDIHTLLNRTYTRMLGRCRGFEGFDLGVTALNGYPATRLLLHCPHQERSGKGLTALYQIMETPSAIYSVQRVWLTEPYVGGAPPVSQAELDKWATYLDGVVVCVEDSADHPC